MSKNLNPEAVDGDLDGLVQDSTKFERPAGTHLVVDGDTYAALGDLYKTGKETAHAKAEAIFALNGGKNLVAGDFIKVK